MFGMSKKELLLYGVVGVALGLVLWAVDSFVGSASRPHFQHADLTITRANGTKVSFATEVANSVDEQSYGLMFVNALDEDEECFKARYVSQKNRLCRLPLGRLFWPRHL